MEKLAQLMIDVKDDPQVSLLKEIFPTYNDLPDIIKTASMKEPSEHEYALVLLNDGYKFKKFAMHDAGNTALSILYFVANHEQLPDEAIKVAAENLIDAAGRFRLKVPKELEGIIDTLKSRGIEIRTRDKHWQPVDSLQEVSEISAGKLPRNHEKTASLGRHLDNATAIGALGAFTGAIAGAAGHKNPLEGAVRGAGAGAIMGGLTGAGASALGKNNQFGVMLPPKARPSHYIKDEYNEGTDYEGDIDRHNATSDKKAPNPWKEKKAETLAVGNQVDVSKAQAPKRKISLDAKHKIMDQYPVDTADQVKMATDFFKEYWREFEPAERREYCVKLAERLQAHLLPVPHDVDRYAADTYSNDLEQHIAYRKNFVDPELHDVLDTLVSQQDIVRPDTFAEALTAFDKTAGIDKFWDSKLYDPYKTTFGPSLFKLAENHWNYKENGLYINERDLMNLANENIMRIREQFGNEFADKYRRDPRKAFESLDADLKLLLARMASQNY